ncbi:Spx/MgsR family RNA polymerase-binding regulatory protein [Wenzhouxiangella sp. EGI_FJ10305]|uniref:Spx/MgsR family RNA polymerase-binding regulatory protein n=1 Tax=Wenzhouxiangella sp. EGI_FJ10305 TaxID=3243768 RepID=UPI0035D7A354
MIDVYGIGNCDACRRACKWLEQSGRAYRWHDLRTDGIDESTLRGWIDAVGLEKLVNRRSTTWRSLDENDRARALDGGAAPALLLRHPTLIKRPVFELAEAVMVGFTDSVKRAL